MPDYVKDMLGLPTEKQKRSRSEPRSPRGSAVNVSRCKVRPLFKLSPGPTKECSHSEASKTIQIPTRSAAVSFTLTKVCRAREEKTAQSLP